MTIVLVAHHQVIVLTLICQLRNILSSLSFVQLTSSSLSHQLVRDFVILHYAVEGVLSNCYMMLVGCDCELASPASVARLCRKPERLTNIISLFS